MMQREFDTALLGLGNHCMEPNIKGLVPKTSEPSEQAAELPTVVDNETFLGILAAKSASRLPAGFTPVTGKMLAEMQAFGRRWKKGHPLGTQEQMESAIKGFFNLTVISEEPSVTQSAEDVHE